MNERHDIDGIREHMDDEPHAALQLIAQIGRENNGKQAIAA